ncbi:MAG: hypothetical protein EZS28_040721 [Streblomastix strix]|uniref:Uncharacterized protein n=1 Tax=Streblomastix strix TaxID=222440 RepID=A0A5J4U180_9EUKA|nr:MAG: hypothetical protein EZS28_040721 [Streblomastix strix]
MSDTGKQSASEDETLAQDENKQYQQYVKRIKEIKNITIARSKENRTEMAGRTLLKEFTEMLQFSRKLQAQEHARNTQTGVCEAFCIIMSDNPEGIELAINKSDIVGELMKLLSEDIPLEEIEVIHVSALKLLCTFGKPEHRRQFKDANIVLYTAAALYKLISGEWYLVGYKCLHPYFKTFEEQGINIILFEDGLKKGNCQKTVDLSAQCLSLLYQQRELPENMKKDVITQLKQGLYNIDKADIKCSSRGLLSLAQNKGNVDMILADNFLVELEEVIKVSQLGSTGIDKLLQELQFHY